MKCQERDSSKFCPDKRKILNVIEEYQEYENSNEGNRYLSKMLDILYGVDHCIYHCFIGELCSGEGKLSCYNVKIYKFYAGPMYKC